ncbi:MAG: glycine--tRNA ligase [Candidatus Paceibacterota bacterium]
MEKIISLAKRRGFIFPGSEIYGGLQNSWDFGPLGVELKRIIKNEWWRRFVTAREDMVGLDAAILMNPKTWEASGHVATFSDPLVECKSCHARFRADQIDTSTPCASCKKSDGFTDAKEFNLMLKTSLGATEGEGSEVFFRPETAQGIFVNFKNVLDTTRVRVPFGIAQIGKAFRNEITPGNFIFRTREFEQMEIEYFVREEEWEKWFEHWKGEMETWMRDLGIEKDTVAVEVEGDDLAHYSKRTIDFEYKFPFGQKELYGLAYRTDHDLQAHAKASGKSMEYMNPEDSADRFVPHVIEPSLGVERTVLAVLLSAYAEESLDRLETKEGGESRIVMKFPYWLSPVKVAILPLMKKDGLAEKAHEVFGALKNDFTCQYDESGSIGKRYRRQDEIGTPFCITIDHQTLEDSTVTVRDRDSLSQERLATTELAQFFAEKI